MRLPTPTRTPKKLGFFITYVFPWPFLMAGIAMLAFGFRSLQAARASSSWPTAEGTVTSSKVESSRSRSGSRNSTTYHARVKYTYSVGGQSHKGDRVAFGDYGSSISSHARGIVARYPVGIKVDVFHAPAAPGQSVLEPGVKGQAFILPGIGTIFTIVGLVMLIFLPIAARRAAKRYDEALGVGA